MITSVRALVGVNAEMIEEIVPLAEVLSAGSKVAFKDLDTALWLGIQERENAVSLGGGHVLFYLDGVQVEVAAVLDADFDEVRDVVFEGVVDLVT